MFGWVEFKEDEKKKKKRRELFFLSVWLKGGEGKKLMELGCFLPRSTKMFPPQIWKKTRENIDGL